MELESPPPPKKSKKITQYIPGLQYDWRLGMTESQLDIVIASGTFISGFMFESLNSFGQLVDCSDSFCRTYGIFLNITTLMWFNIAFMALYVRLYTHKFLLVQYALRITQIFCMVITIITINMAAWFRNSSSLGKISGVTIGSMTTITTVGYVTLFLYDFYKYRERQ